MEGWSGEGCLETGLAYGINYSFLCQVSSRCTSLFAQASENCPQLLHYKESIWQQINTTLNQGTVDDVWPAIISAPLLCQDMFLSMLMTACRMCLIFQQ